MKKLAIICSERKELLEAIVKHFGNLNSGNEIEITCLSNILDGNALKCAAEYHIKHKYLPNEKIEEYLEMHNFDLIALADFSNELSANLLEQKCFLSIHPSLLPAFKEKDAILQAFQAGVKVSGVTVYRCGANIECAKIIAQYPVLIENLMHFDEFENAVHNLENFLYPIVIEKILQDKVFDFSDLFGGCGGNSGGCSGCGGCH